jgi:transposase
MYPFYLGLDLHNRKTYAVLMDQDGELVDQREFPNEETTTYLEKFVPHETYAVLEATRNWPFMYDLLSQHVERVELAHPKELKAISTAAVKTDQIDAKVLAHLARLNFLPTAYAAPPETRDLRLYIRHREKLVQDRTQSKNRIHAVLASYNLRIPGSNPFGKAGREWLQDILDSDLLRPAAKRVIRDHLALIDQLGAQVAALENDLVLTPEQEAAVRLLKTIPGVGSVIATTIVAEIGNIRRFNSPKALCNWAGLTPRIRSSAGITRHGHISKEGSPFLRNAMTQTANGAVRFSKRWRLVYQNLSQRCGKKGARVAVARRLLTVVYHMLKRNEPYQEDYSQAPVNRGA